MLVRIVVVACKAKQVRPGTYYYCSWQLCCGCNLLFVPAPRAPITFCFGAARFLPFLEYTTDMADFCQREVEPMGKECEQVYYCADCANWNIY